MREKLRVSLPVIVEGKYDKNTLSQVLDATILTTGGFSVFNSKEKQALLRRLCKDGAIVLTDSDGGGRQIRAFLSSILPKEAIHPLYIPEIKGKERRKSAPSKSGTLGVEGMDADLLYDLFLPLSDGVPREKGEPITKTDFYFLGLTGKDNASERRDALAVSLSLPRGMGAGPLLAAVNLLYSREAFLSYAEALLSQKEVSLG
ncbi:MAG: DUF4093 domain-containing protein [Clostridia bacterium]|nr:DUF4093 domain-containing protein [Clostridia bacterium]